MKVPLFDARTQFETLRGALMAATERVLASGTYVLGPEVEAFELEIARYLGVRHAIGVASGTDALWLALKALGIGAGDRVLTSPFTFFATASAICNNGAEPVFADIDPRTFNLNPDEVRRVLEGRFKRHDQLGIKPGQIKAIIPVHLFGQPAAMAELMTLSRDHGLFVVEDAAQALGATYRGRKVGAFGHVGCLSFFPTKNLGAFGDGGLVVTSDDNLAEKMRSLRAHGAKKKYYHHLLGTNSRLDELQAALLRVKLPCLNAWIEARQNHAAFYDRIVQSLPEVIVPDVPADQSHAYHQYTVRVLNGRRESLRSYLKSQGVDAQVYYPVPVHLQSALIGQGYRDGDFPAAEKASAEVLSLPIFPELTENQREYVAAQMGEFFRPER